MFKDVGIRRGNNSEREPRKHRWLPEISKHGDYQRTYKKGGVMAIQKFKNGSVLYTGKDIGDAIYKALNKRNKFDRECSFCIHEGEDFCDDCSLFTGDLACSCHINPPCSICTDSRFEVSPYLINYKHFKNGKRPWECYRADEKTFKKLGAIEAEGFYANAETLGTGEIAMYITKGEYDDINICKKIEFKTKMSEFINNFDILSAQREAKEINEGEA